MVEDVDPAKLIAEGRLEEFVLQLRPGAERGALIAALRPTWGDLVPALFQFRAAMHEGLLEPVTEVLAPLELRPATDGSAFSAGARVRAGGQLDVAHSLVEEQLRAYTGALSDHLWGLAATMSAEPPVRPAFVIGRVLLDAGAHLYYLADSAVSPAERTVRAANIRLSALYDELGDFEGDDDGTARLRAEIDGLLDSARSDGFMTMRVRRNSTQQCLQPRTPSTGVLAADLLGSLGPDAWRTLSSAVHAQDRPVLELSTGRGSFASTVQGRSQAALHLGASVLMCTEAVRRAIQFRGLDAGLADRAAAQLNTLWMAAAGLKDAQYAAGID